MLASRLRGPYLRLRRERYSAASALSVSETAQAQDSNLPESKARNKRATSVRERRYLAVFERAETRMSTTSRTALYRLYNFRNLVLYPTELRALLQSAYDSGLFHDPQRVDLNS